MAEYVAEYRWDGHAWVVQFRKPDISTFGRSLTAAKGYARDALAVYLEVPDLVAAGASVEDDVRLPRDIAAEVRRLTQRRAKADALRSEVAAATRQAAIELRSRGYSTRDVGEILGISGARVAQIEREAGSS